MTMKVRKFRGKDNKFTINHDQFHAYFIVILNADMPNRRNVPRTYCFRSILL